MRDDPDMTITGESGFCIPYTVRPTPDKGLGVFAGASISKGAILWRHIRGCYAVYDEQMFRKRVAKLTRDEVIYELHHSFGLPEFPGYVIRVFDDGELINHSREPTVALNSLNEGREIPYDRSADDARGVEEALLSERFALIAARDVEMGEELTLDYGVGTEDPAYYDALCAEYDVEWPWM